MNALLILWFYAENTGQIFTRMRSLAGCNLFGSSADNNFAASVAALGTEIDYIIGALYDIEVVLNDNDGVSSLDERLDNIDKTVDVGCMQTCRRLVEHEYRASRRSL